jgi:signal transduction histidine kinase/CheY-like chemotaxis protein
MAHYHFARPLDCARQLSPGVFVIDRAIKRVPIQRGSRIAGLMSGRSRRIAFGLTLSAWVACSGVAGLIAERHAGRVQTEAEAAALARAEIGAEAMEQSLLRTLEAVEGLHDLAASRQRLLETGDQRGAEAIEGQLTTVAQRGRFGVVHVGVIGSDGWLSWSSEPGWERIDLSDREHFNVHRDRSHTLFVSAPLMGRTSERWGVQLSRPLYDRSGSFAGVAVVSIDPLELSHDLAGLDPSVGSSAIVLRRDGGILARSRSAHTALGQTFGREVPLMAAIGPTRAGRLRVLGSAFDGRPKLVGYRVLASAPLAVAVALDLEQELKPTAFVRPALWAAATAISLLALTVAGLMLLWLERRRTQADLDLVRLEREAALDRLAHAQRMEALGQLAGGVAHDFNNVLQAVLGAAKLIQRRSSDACAVQRLTDTLVEAAERGASVTRRLLAFARRSDLRAEAVRIGPLLAGLSEVLTHTLGASIEVQIKADPALPPVLTDSGELETVLVNLAINSRDAMAPSGGGTLTILAVTEEVTAGGQSKANLPPGTYVRLAVSDTGGGMDATTQARAVEPFFTTKPKGQGTGLGLAMAQGFAAQSGGAFMIESEIGRGTVITLWLPKAAGEASPENTVSQVSLHPEEGKPGGRLLVVDDEPQVLATVAEALRERSYHVEEAQDGPSALKQLALTGSFDVLVTDLAMPGMSGLDLLREARSRLPGLPALIVTGHAGDACPEGLAAAVGDGPLMLLRKPVGPDEIADHVAAIIRTGDAP